MAIETAYSPAKISGTGTKTDFSFGFKIYSKDDVRVTLIEKTSLVVEELSEGAGADYTVTINTVSEGGQVIMSTAPPSNKWVFIESNLDYTQPVLFKLTGKLNEKEVERMGDRLLRLIQQNNFKTQRALVFRDDLDLSSISSELPTPVADKYLGWNAGATALENKSDPTETGTYPGEIDAGLDANKAAIPSVNDLYLATDTGILYACYSAGTWTDLSGFLISGLSAITSLASGDQFAFADNSDSNNNKKVTFTNLVSNVLAALDINALTGKTTPVDADEFLLSDSAASNAKKKVTLANLKDVLGKGWVFIEEQVASSDASIEIDLPTGYSMFVLVLYKVRPVTDNVFFLLRTSSDNGANFDDGASDYGWFGHEGTGSRDETDDAIRLSPANQLGNLSDELFNAFIEIYDPHNASTYTFFGYTPRYTGAGGSLRAPACAGRRVSAGAVNALQFYMESGNIQEGVFRLYGLKGA